MNIYVVSRSKILTKEQLLGLGKYGEVTEKIFRKLDENGVRGIIKKAEILLISPSVIGKMDENLLSGAGKLKLVVLMSSGEDWMDIDAAGKQGIEVRSCQGANSVAVAEYTWSMILCLARKLLLLNKGIKSEGVELDGKTIGILGLGKVGEKVAWLAKSFNMNVLSVSRKDNVVSLKKLLRQSDVISINLPLTKETELYIKKNEVSLMKKGVILVNTARERIVDDEAILYGLKKGIIGGYGVDLDIGNFDKRVKLYSDFDNVLVTPHSGYNTKESKERIIKMAIEKVKEYYETKK